MKKKDLAGSLIWILYKMQIRTTHCQNSGK